MQQKRELNKTGTVIMLLFIAIMVIGNFIATMMLHDSLSPLRTLVAIVAISICIQILLKNERTSRPRQAKK